MPVDNTSGSLNVKHMKWWGWGEDHIAFSHDDKPGLAPFILENLGLDVSVDAVGRPDFTQLNIPPSQLPDDLSKRLVSAVGEANVITESMERVVHTYGKSLRDLLRVRAGDLGRLPDAVVYPADDDQVVQIVQAALDENAVIIPFGGGTNIAGSLEAPREETRPVISLDLGRLDRVLEIDEHSQLARIQAGVLGPSLEAQLQARGFTLGHFPDSFNHSTLGGWIATRSSGMQSDKYGDIADITKGLRVITPNGTLVTRAVPSTSTGPSVREMILGSEGRLGVITEATIHVHRNPENRIILGYLFPNWSAGLKAMRDIAASDAAVSVTRISDARETRFSFATRKEGKKLDHVVSGLLQKYLDKRKHFDLNNMCLSFIGYEGSSDHIKRQKSLVGDIVRHYNGVCVGKSPGQLYDQKKFDTPYIRDFLLDRGGLADVSETSTSWSHIEPLYDGVIAAANQAFARIGVKGWIMCHMSHSYHSGACLYFTFAFSSSNNGDELAQYETVKSAIQQGFMDYGGTLSHHHGVGIEHKPWMAQDISESGVKMIEALLNGVDPGTKFQSWKDRLNTSRRASLSLALSVVCTSSWIVWQHQLGQISRLVVLVVALAAFGLAFRQRASIQISVLVVAATAGLVVAVATPPRGSQDVYSYAMYGRMVSTYHQNPYTHQPNEHPADPLLAYVAPGWQHVPSVYGPLFTGVSAGFSAISGESATANRLLHQLLSAIALLAVVLTKGPGNKTAWLVLGINPAVLAIVNGGHNDLLMGALVALALLALQRRRVLISACLVAAAILIKAAAVVALIAMVITLLARQRRHALQISALATTLVVATYATFGRTDALRAVMNGSNVTSRASVLAIPHHLGHAATVVISVVLGAALIWYWVLRPRSVEPLRNTVVAIVAVIYSSPYVLAWYSGWVLPLAAVCESNLLTASVLGQSGALLLAYSTPPGIHTGVVMAVVSGVALPVSLLVSARRLSSKG